MEATVASFVPLLISEMKPGLIPEEYTIQPSDGKTPSILIVPDNVESPLYRGGDMPAFRVPIRAEDLAKDIVESYNTSQLGYEEGTHPALFWVPGKHLAPSIMSDFKAEVDKAMKAHNRWCLKLVRLADDDWFKNRRHKTISDIQRFAARTLGLTNKEWYATPEPEAMVECPSCTSLIPGRAKKCKVCGEFVEAVNKATK
jgi:hypothetical protein